MWIVKLALRRPYTFVVASILILILGTVSILRTPTDIFPNIDIPVISVIFNYGGFSPDDMSNRIIYIYERILTTTVDDIEHIESQSLTGVGIVKIYFHPGVQISTAISQVTSVSQTIVRQLPTGTTPPLVIAYNASTVPILQLSLSSSTLNEQQLSDSGLNFIRPQLVTVPGVALPYPYGGKQRAVMIDLDLAALQAKGLSPMDVVSTVASQNLILPGGTAKIGTYEYQVDMNGPATTVADINNLPIKSEGGTTTYIHDVGNARDGFNPQTNIVRVNGQRSVLISILKNGAYSTLDIIKAVKAKLPEIEDTIPFKVDMKPVSDQSLFVLASIQGVVREGAIAACLTGLMILLFLGSWRSTVIIAVSIPLSILASLIVLSALGETINIMTLGGLALAVGILVDDATVAMENIHRNLDQGKELYQSILDGSAQISVPALVSTLAICIVFVPMFFLTGVPKFLFAPLAEAVVFAMLASYLLSRTLVPTMARYLLLQQTEEERREITRKSRNPFVRLQMAFEEGFERFRHGYHRLLEGAVHHRKLFTVCFFAICVLSFGLLPLVGQDFFPRVDSGEFKFHVRAPIGTRIEETASLCDNIEADIRRTIPPAQLANIVDNIGLPYSGINLSYSTSAPIGPEDADIQVELAPDHRPTNEYVRSLREKLPRDFPGVTFYELPVDIVTQILDFGLPAPLDVEVVGRNVVANHDFAARLMDQLRQVPGVVDLRIQQPLDYPRLHIDVDRTKASLVGLTQRDVATNLLLSLSGSGQTSPTFWLDPTSGVSYSVASMSPQYRVDSLQDLENIPINGAAHNAPQILAGLASITRSGGMGAISHYNIQSVVDIYGAVDGRDLGSVAREIAPIIARSRKDLPRGSQIAVRGQIETMNSSFNGLLGGLVFSILLVYLLIVVNFQSWLDPFIILMALPAALAGIVWFLFVTGTTVSVPALTGAIMCMGVATANSILVVSFSKERLAEGKTSIEAALEAGFTRFRPVLMTALAMIIGMLPMSLGLGEGGEQNAPLGRAVIGGLLFATVATLFFVPVFFSIVHGRKEAFGPQGKGSSAMPAGEESGNGGVGGRSPRSSGRAALGVVIALLVAAIVVIAGIVPRMRARAELQQTTQQLATPSVDLVRPNPGAPQTEIVLPGNIEAFVDSPIYSRTSGYLKKWYADIGVHVKLGQLLAEIETPEVDQQLDQARADLNTAQANYNLAQITAQRYSDLLKSNSVSQQDVDNATGEFAAKKAMLASAQSNVNRLEQLQSFEKIYAPFDGVITARNTDVGHLINSGASGPDNELFHIAAISRLRVFISLPQQYSASVKPGLPATLELQEFPGHTFKGVLARTAEAIDPASRTLLTEIDVDNSSGQLLPGAFAQVHLKIASGASTVLLPVTALIFRAQGLQAAVVNDGKHIELRNVTLGRDLGSQVEVASGLTQQDSVVLNPPDSLVAGEEVRVVSAGNNPANASSPSSAGGR